MFKSIIRPAFPVSLLAVSAQLTAAAFVDTTFNIVNARISPDGFPRDTALVNGQFPGTVVYANKGDVLRNTVVTQLTNPAIRRSTSIVSAF
jgi:iron transport multicopper oxidase